MIGLYGSGARKHPSNEGRVSGEGVSFAGHIFIPHQFFNLIKKWEKFNCWFQFDNSTIVVRVVNEKSIP